MSLGTTAITNEEQGELEVQVSLDTALSTLTTLVDKRDYKSAWNYVQTLPGEIRFQLSDNPTYRIAKKRKGASF